MIFLSDGSVDWDGDYVTVLTIGSPIVTGLMASGAMMIYAALNRGILAAIASGIGAFMLAAPLGLVTSTLALRTASFFLRRKRRK